MVNTLDPRLRGPGWSPESDQEVDVFLGKRVPS